MQPGSSLVFPSERGIEARLNRIAGNRPRQTCVPRSIGAGEELKLNSVDGRKVCGQPSEQSFKSATGRRCARGTSPESDATRWFGGVRLGGTVDGDVAAAAAPPSARVSRKEEGKGRRNQKQQVWSAAVPRGPGPRLGRRVGPKRRWAWSY